MIVIKNVLFKAVCLKNYYFQSMMKSYNHKLQIRWADLDANGHLRHTVYYDWGSFCRVTFLNEHGLSISKMQELHIGPVLFREECVFKKEIHLGDQVTINLELLKARKDFSRWCVRHTIFKEDYIAAIVIVEGSWMDTVERKLAKPVAEIKKVYAQMPVAANFEWLD